MNAIIRTSELLKDRLKTHVWPPGTRMPSIYELAKQCSVSSTTVWKAIGLLKKESLISTKRGGFITAGPPGTDAHQTTGRAQIWEKTRAAIVQDIFAGTFHGIQLPPINKLSLQYGAAIDTVKKALDRLTEEKIVARTGRGFRFLPGTSPHGNNRIVFISNGNRERGISLDFRTESLLNLFERECQRCGYLSTCEGFNPQTPAGLLEFTSAFRALPKPAGAIVNLWATWNKEQWLRWLDLIRFLSQQNLPIVVIDHPGDASLPHDIYASKWVRMLRIAGIRAGEMVAEYLFRKGHSRVAYITPYFNQAWAKSRYEGLSRYYRQQGHAGGQVELFALSEAMNQLDLTVAALGTGPAGIRSLFGDSTSDNDIGQMIDTLDRVRRSGLAKKVDSGPVAQSIRHMTTSLIDLGKQKHDKQAFETFLNALMHVASKNAIQEYMQPFYRKILNASNATAWVCSDDKTSIHALLFLKNAGIKVPEQVSVIGFNNWHDELELQLSSYDFNMDGFIQQAFMMIMDSKTLKSRPKVSEVDGYVVERRTTRR